MDAANRDDIRRMSAADLQERLRRVRLAVFDFDGVFTDNTVYVSQDGVEMVRCWRSDGLGLQKLAALGIATLILSTEANPVVSVRAAKLRIPCRQGLADKAAALVEVVTEHGCSLEETAYMGNDINDAGCLRLAGVPVAVADAHPDILPLVALQTAAAGGFGAVRELCDLICASHDRRPLQSA